MINIRKHIAIAAMSAAMMPAVAQETYENARLAGSDLNGTARYVGMGGALEALGADISTISTNPAGIGMFRHNNVSTTFGVVTQQDAKNFRTGNKTKMSYDQLGLVLSLRTNSQSYLNFAFNYHKSTNLNYILSVTDAINAPGSQNMLSFIKGIGATVDGQSEFNFAKGNGTSYWTSQLDNVYYNNFIVAPDGTVGYNQASAYMMNRANVGAINEYDLNISGNINNRVYLGATVGIYNVHYKGVSEYTEDLVDYSNAYVGSLTVTDERKVTGSGVDFKAGIIFLPIDESPFRVGLSIASPTFYDLTTENRTRLADNIGYPAYDRGYESQAYYDYEVRTPWKFGLSAAHTVGNSLALGASYEYADYGSMDTRYKTGQHYDWWDGSYSSDSESDENMNTHTQEALKGVSTFKIGAEFRPDPTMAVRLGYNYLSPMYKDGAFKDGFVDSYGSNCSSATDYTNWKSTNRITCGLGYKMNNLSIDLAYQYTVKNGNFSPYQPAWGDYDHFGYDDNGNTIVDDLGQPVTITDAIDVVPPVSKVSFKRHQLMLTLGYTF